jgi:hypothetical protein
VRWSPADPLMAVLADGRVRKLVILCTDERDFSAPEWWPKEDTSGRRPVMGFDHYKNHLRVFCSRAKPGRPRLLAVEVQAGRQPVGGEPEWSSVPVEWERGTCVDVAKIQLVREKNVYYRLRIRAKYYYSAASKW